MSAQEGCRSAPIRTPRCVAAGLAALLLVFAACGGDGDDSAAGGMEKVTLQVSAIDNSFDPSSLSAAAGSEVTVELTNDGDNPHTFTIDDPEADTSTVDGGGSATATFVMPERSVTFYCAIHGEKTMAGTIDPS